MYKSQYENPYRNGDSKDQDLSLHREPEITTSIKENKEAQTAEVEKGEIIAKPDLGALYKAKGKMHYDGGIKTYLEPESFVFSNHKSMSFSEKDHDLMELKKGGSFKKKINTPAEVLKRNVDIEHYNRLLNNMDDDKKDDLAKKSSALMLAKYQEAIGKIAFLQESKKSFEEGIPEFAQNSAPVYDGDLKTDIKEQKQYMKYGGIMLPAKSTGGLLDDMGKCPCGEDIQGNCLPCTETQLNALKNKARTTTLNNVANLLPIGRAKGFDYYHNGANPTSITGAGPIKQTPGPKMSNADWLKFTQSPERIKWRKEHQMIKPGWDDLAKIPVQRNAKITPGEIGYDNGPAPVPELKTGPVDPYNPTVGMSRDQLLNLGYAGLNQVMVKRYDPYRPQISSPLLEQEYFNPQNALNQASGAAESAYAASRVLNPYLANAANQETTGKLLDNFNNITAQYAERNVGVGNQQNIANNQIQRQDAMANLGFDAKYYDQTVAAGQNFDDLKAVARNETMSLYNNYRGQNRQLQEFLAQQPIAGTVDIKDKNGKVIRRQEMPLYGYDSWKGISYKTPAGNILNARAQPQQSSYVNAYNTILKKFMDGTATREDGLALTTLGKIAFSDKANLGQQYKKGGRVNPYK